MLSEYVVKDLNRDASLPFGDNEFDVVTNAVSIDYLTQPLAVTKFVFASGIPHCCFFTSLHELPLSGK